MGSVRVYNPIGRMSGVEGQLAPSVDLTGKRLVLFDNSKPNAPELLETIGRALQERYKGLELAFANKRNATIAASPGEIAEICKTADVVLTGSGD